MLFAAGVLNRALTLIVKLVPKRSTLPVLEHILFEPADPGIAITATDLTTRATIVVSTKTPFATCLPARQLLEFVSSIDRDAEISMSQHDTIVRVVTSGSSIDLPSRPVVEFPGPIKNVGTGLEVSDPAAFLDALGWVARAVGEDFTRPQLMGVMFDGDAIVATDGHRLHRAKIAGLKCPRALVLSTAVAFILRALKNQTIAISVNDTTVRFSSPTWTITTRVLDEKFPPYEQVIPKAKGAAFTMRVGAGDLEAGLTRVCGRGSKAHGNRTIKMFANGTIKLESNIADVQRVATVDVLETTHEGPDHLQGFNGLYLIDAIADIDTVATLRFFKADDPLLVEVADRTAVVMPWRL